jgi:hypothetical protein
MFFKDGTALNRMPAEGLLSFDPAWLRSEFADYMGTYTVKGDVVTVTTGASGGQQLTEVLTLKDGSLYLGETEYRRIPDLQPALDGAYIKIDYQRHSPDLRNGITFRRDGSFMDEGFNSILGVRWWCGDQYWLTGFPAAPGNGKWRVEKNTLELIYEDGRRHRYAFHVHHDVGNKDLKYLVLNGRFLMRIGEPEKATPEPEPEPAPPLPAQDTQLGDWVFAMPAGWSIKADSKGKPVLKARHTAADFDAWAEPGATVELQEDFAKWFDKHWQKLSKQYAVDESDPPQTQQSPRKFDMLAAGTVGKTAAGNPCLVMLVALHKGGRAGALTFISSDLERLEPDIGSMDTLLSSASLASCRAAGELAPALVAHVDPLCTPSFLWGQPEPIKGDYPLHGIYGMPGMRATGVSGPSANELVFKYYTFFADGRVLRQMPPEGLLSFRFEHWQQYFKFDCGRYKVEGDNVVVTLNRPEGAPEVLTYKREGDALVNGDVKYRLIAPDQPKPEGRWLRHGHEGREERFQLGITFNKDGSFKDEGFNSTTRIGWWCGSDFLLRDVEAGANPGAGKWRVEKNTLELIYEDGRMRRFGYHVQESDGRKQMVLNGEYFARVD